MWTTLGGDVFDFTTEFYTGQDEEMASRGEDTCVLLSSFPGNPINSISSCLYQMVTNAQTETIIHNPYITDEEFWETLKKLDPTQQAKIHLVSSLQTNGTIFLLVFFSYQVSILTH